MSDYKIKEALNLETGQYVSAEQYFQSQEEADLFRERRRVEEIRRAEHRAVYICPYCNQPLVFRGSCGRGQTLHFRHEQNSEDCPLKSENSFTAEEICRIKYNGAKESQLHKNMKKWIVGSLQTDPDFSEILPETIFRSKGCSKEWRKPDVQAVYQQKQPVVFEAQLSTTFLSVIVGRDAFYKAKKTFIVWVFNDFHDDLTQQRFTDKDILYANRNNIFIVNENTLNKSREAETLILLCCSLQTSLKGSGIKSNWQKEYVKFKDLRFDYDQYRIYWRDVVAEYKKCLIAKEKQDAAMEAKRQAARNRIECFKVEREELKSKMKLRSDMQIAYHSIPDKGLIDFTKDERDLFEERVAIMQFDGKISREEAEINARKFIIQRRHL